MEKQAKNHGQVHFIYMHTVDYLIETWHLVTVMELHFQYIPSVGSIGN